MKECSLNRFKLIWVSLLLVFLSSPLSAATFGIFEYIASGGFVKITNCSRSIEGDIVIPSEIDGFPVSRIGSSAFKDCSSVTGVTIPSSVHSIDSYAFAGCSNLTKIAIPSRVKSIGWYAFMNCPSLTDISVEQENLQYSSLGGVLFNREQTTLIQYPIKKSGAYSIPQGVIKIENRAFLNCVNLSSITISSSVSSIGSFAFSGCLNLVSYNVEQGNQQYSSLGGVLFSVAQGMLIKCPITKSGSYTIPASVVSIGSYAFADCSSLTGITILNSVTSIGSSAFVGCSNVSNIIIPSDVTRIEGSTFASCSSLTSITIPASVTNIERFAFSLCTSLASINVEQGNLYFKSVDGVLFNSTLTTLEVHPAGKVGAYTVPPSVTRIESYSFKDCSSLTGVTIPSSVEIIGNYAFQRSGLTGDITIPSSVEIIGTGAFRECPNLTEFSVDLDNSFFNSTGGVLFSSGLGPKLIQYPINKHGTFTIPFGTQKIEQYAFYQCSHLSAVIIPASVLEIGSWAFMECTSLVSIVIPSGVRSMGSATFMGCAGLVSVAIPPRVNGYDIGIGGSAFSLCSSLSSITISSGVKIIGDLAFFSCTSLVSVIIPSSVTIISESAFQSCSNLNATYFLGDEPVLGLEVFYSVNPSHKIYYLSSSTGFSSPTWYGYSTQMIDTTIYPAASWLVESSHSYDTNLNQDLNGDGVSLLMAYALDMNPNERLTNHLPKAELSSDSVSLKYYGGSTGVNYRVESSKDLDTWDVTDVTVSDSDANGVLTASIPRDEVCGFLRLVVVED